MEELISQYAKLPMRQRLGAFAFLLVLVGVMDWQFIYDGQARRITMLESQYNQLETERAAQQAITQNMPMYEARLAELQENLNTARAQLPDDPDVPELLSQLGNKAHQAGLKIMRFEPRGESARDFYAEIVFDMKVQGSYHEIGTFIDSLAKLDRILNVTGIAMTAPRTVNQKVVVEGAFTIKTFRFLEPASTARKGT